MLDGSCLVNFASDRNCTFTGSGDSLVFLPVAVHGWPGFPGISMGHAAFGNGFPGDISGSIGMPAAFSAEDRIINNHIVVTLVAFVPTDIFVRAGEIEQWRPDVAQFHRAVRSLSDAA